ILQIIKKLAVLILPFFILLPLYCAHFQMYYMDDEYAMYRQQRDYCLGKNGDNGDEPELLILGDSRAKAGLVPEVLSPHSYNLALGGATPIEGYYSLKEYLAHHKKPKTLLLAYAPMHYMDVDTLWTRTVYFHNMSKSDFFEIMENAKQYEKTDRIRMDHYVSEYYMYELYMPNKYATALKNSGFVFRHQRTLAKYAEMEANRGHTLYGTEAYSSGVNGEAHETDFVSSDIIDAYVDKLLDLCSRESIAVVVEQLPMNETSYGILQPEFKSHYKEYMLGLAERYPEVTVNPSLYCYDNAYFGDADHLNAAGCEVFTQYIKEKYGYR
ncbi:MAG: hypothetical protein IJ711_03580, partial [Lachnospiraceae bacterium]|nr:hypothetical protein [Lachnospiraceae bacterium]